MANRNGRTPPKLIKLLKYQHFLIEISRECATFFQMRTLKIATASWRTELPPLASPIGISRGTPRRTTGYHRIRALEPGNWFRSVSPARYIELYGEVLDRLDPREIYDRLMGFGDFPVLLCWESPADCHAGKAWCHRHLAAQWLEDRLDIQVHEVGHPNLDRFAFLRQRGIAAPDYRHNRSAAIASDNPPSRNQSATAYHGFGLARRDVEVAGNRLLAQPLARGRARIQPLHNGDRTTVGVFENGTET
jgi:hypothetical protein